ncbi:MAG: DUF5009 domain-containing protein [Bacteroidota bacterium]
MKERIASIDVLRGMTILLMIIVNTPGSWSYVYPQLLHAKWHGCTPTDLVFPSFLFIVGLTLAISFKQITIGAMPRVFKRGALIFLVGILLNWFPFFTTHISELRIFGVLQRIALAFTGATLILITTRSNKKLIALAVVSLLVTHWLCLILFGDAGSPFSLDGNFARTVDLAILDKQHLYGGLGIPFDPEGLLGTLSSIAQVLMGYLTAKWILSVPLTPKKVRELMLAGATLIVLGITTDVYYPINKPLWTASYVCYTSGIIMIIWALMIWIIDLKKATRWTFPLQVVGINPLISYVFSSVLSSTLANIPVSEGSSLYGWLYIHVFQVIFGNYLGSFAFALTFTSLIWLMAWWLYRKKIVVKL